MSFEKDKKLKFYQYMMSNKNLYNIYADLESMIKTNRWMYKQSRKILRKKTKKTYSL